MTTYHERRFDILSQRLRARTKSDGTPLPGYAENVAAIKAELGLLNERIDAARGEEN